MKAAERTGGLELDEQPGHERASWIAERVAWGVIVLVIVAAMLGLFGKGVFAQVTAASLDGGVEVDFRRFDRLDAATEWTVRLAPRPRAGDGVTIWIERSLLAGYRVEQVTPPASRVLLEGDRLVYEFAAADPPGERTVTFHLRPSRPGRHAGAIGAAGPGAAVSQFIYP